MKSENFYTFKAQAEDRMQNILNIAITAQYDTYDQHFVKILSQNLYDYGLWCFEMGKSIARENDNEKQRID